MLHLFKIEWLKVKTYKAFWILLLCFIVLYPVAFYFSANNFMTGHSGNTSEETLKSMMGGPFVFPKVWLSASWFGGLFFIMIGMLYILLITNEVQYRTHRQNIIDGWSRFDFLKAKLTMLIFFVLVSTSLVFLCGLLVGKTFSKSGDAIFEGIKYVGYFALMATLYLMAAFLVAILVKRTGLAIIIYFAFACIIDNILWLVLTLNGNQMGYFMPLESVDSLVPNPFKPAMMEKRTVADYTLMIAAASYILVFAFVIVSYFRKADLKT